MSLSRCRCTFATALNIKIMVISDSPSACVPCLCHDALPAALWSNFRPPLFGDFHFKSSTLIVSGLFCRAGHEFAPGASCGMQDLGVVGFRRMALQCYPAPDCACESNVMVAVSTTCKQVTCALADELQGSPEERRHAKEINAAAAVDAGKVGCHCSPSYDAKFSRSAGALCHACDVAWHHRCKPDWRLAHWMADLTIRVPPARQIREDTSFADAAKKAAKSA